MKKSFALISSMAFLPLLLLAHDGHGSTSGYTIIHYIIEPIHAFITLFVAVLAVFIYMKLNRKAKE